MEKVTGIGGVFFRASNPGDLAMWYQEHLGINPVPADYDQRPWIQEEGPTVFAPFERDTDYFGLETQSWMINFGMRNLSKMLSNRIDRNLSIIVWMERSLGMMFIGLGVRIALTEQ